jgi:predicted enzyme related to lactoylglutathione lyase
VGVRSVAIVSVPVSDPDRAKDFYTDILGLTVQEDEPMGDSMRWLRLATPEGEATITLVTWFPSMPPGSLKGLLLRVDDLDAMAARLEGRGVPTANGIETAPWGRFVQIDDPDGNGLVLQEPIEG